MSQADLAGIVRRVTAGSEVHPSDAELLRLYSAAGDNSAFTRLVERYTPLVFGICKRVTRHQQDAEDAFQVTFLVLARKAGQLRQPEAVGNFLFGVAYRTALKTRSLRPRESSLTVEPATVTNESDDGEKALLEKAIHQLPEKYRSALLLCELRGLSRREAAEMLKIPEGTLSSRLAMARRILQKRLRPSAANLIGSGLLLVPATNLPASIVPLLQAKLPTRLLPLFQGVLADMFFYKLKLPVVLLTIALLGTALAGYAWSKQTGQVTSSPTTQTKQPKVLKPLAFFTGADSAINKPEFLRIGSNENWEVAWRRHQGLSLDESYTSMKPKLQFDFKACDVVAIFRGTGTNRKGIRLVGITETDTEVLIRYEDNSYQTEGGSDQTTVYGLLLLPRSEKIVVVERNGQRIKGEPAAWREEARLKPEKLW